MPGVLARQQAQDVALKRGVGVGAVQIIRVREVHPRMSTVEVRLIR